MSAAADEAAASPAPASPASADCEELLPDSLTAPAFQRAVLEGLRAIDGLTVHDVRPFVVRVQYAEQPFVIQLDAVYKRYRHAELETVDAIEELKAALGVPGAAITAAGPYPRLAARSSVAPGIFTLPCPFDDSLAVFFVRALPNGHIPLTPAEVGRDWHGDGAALMAAALEHLGVRTQGVPADGFGDGDQLVLAWHTGDGLDAAAALLPDLLNALAEWVPGTLHVGVPSRDLMLACGDADAGHLASVADDVRAAFDGAGDAAISGRLYRWDGAGLVVEMDGKMDGEMDGA
ncbi:MAG: hypothetical protein ABI780_08375 [Ardenticatenales bacterium]